MNITENKPPKVVKIPTKAVRVPAKARKAQMKRAKAHSRPEFSGREGESDALASRPVEKLRELVNEFNRVKDAARSKNIPIPPSYSQFSDIRDRASLQSNT